jgi:hypothetical protein
MLLRFPTVIYALVVLFTTAPLTAQSCNASVPATIVDATSGNFVPSVQPAMLHAKIKKNLIPVNRVERIRNFRVLLLVDASGSMSSINPNFLSNKQKTVQTIKEMLDQELVNIPEGVQLGFGIFNKEIVFANEFTSDSIRLHHLIPETTARLKKPGAGTTALYEAVHEALTQFAPVQPGDTIVLLTDGVDNESTKMQKSLARELSLSGVRLFVLLVQDELPFSPEEVMAEPIMSELAERSGGAVRACHVGNLFWTDKHRLQQEQQQLDRFWRQEVLSAYLLHFSIPQGIGKDQKWLLAIDPAANGGKKMAAGYPSRLEPCPLTTAAR